MTKLSSSISAVDMFQLGLKPHTSNNISPYYCNENSIEFFVDIQQGMSVFAIFLKLKFKVHQADAKQPCPSICKTAQNLNLKQCEFQDTMAEIVEKIYQPVLKLSSPHKKNKDHKPLRLYKTSKINYQSNILHLKST